MLTIGSLFSGIGGLELGLERAGAGRVVWQCEIDPFARGVLARHWPDAQRFEDVKQMENPPHVDILCGGFPCQDVSVIGERAGLDGDRSGLWWAMVRLVGALRPTYVVVENVYAGHAAWLPDVRRSLWGVGYAAVPVQPRASDVGLPHRRARVFVLAYALGVGLEGVVEAGAAQGATLRARAGEAYAGPVRVADGVPARMVRGAIHAYGNAVVPACAEVVGGWIVNAERNRARGAA